MIVPKALLGELGTAIGQEFEVSVEGGRLVAAPVRDDPRAGWEEAARELAEAGDDVLVWPQFANEADADLKW